MYRDKQKRLSLICLGIALLACALTTILIRTSGADVMAAAILTIYIGIPLMAIILGAVLGYKTGFLFYLFPFILGLLEWIALTLAFNYLNFEALQVILIFTVVPGAVATALGYARHRSKQGQK